MPSYLTTIGQAGSALAMIAVFALLIGAVMLWRRGADRRRPALMLILAAVLVVNVLILNV